MDQSALRQDLLRSMLRIRMVEEAVADLYPEQEMRCPVHLSIGQEAPAAGVCSALANGDQVVSGHRSHAHYLARGGDLARMLAEFYGKATGCTGGLGGSMHLTDPEAGFLAATPIVGSSIPVGVGAALTARNRGEDRVVVVFLGDGAMETGILHESINFAVVHRLPVMFCCENNLYSVYSPMSVRQPPDRSIVEVAAGHGIRTWSGDGNDAEEVAGLAEDAVQAIRLGSGPAFLEFSTYRWREHCGPYYDNDLGYRTQEEFESWRDSDPIEILAQREGWPDREQVALDIAEEIRAAVEFARSSPFPVSDSMRSTLFPSS
ncbi:MAG: acetoin dehydrogenase [Acidimicrobiaceae bacterium]|nr:acetoin dehydrogenase [Acidimicrobiaceae bacterium]|tara:strand:- start:133 stop:1089 length:957 start_codon:yes stop_codon:yes gene_type:complete